MIPLPQNLLLDLVYLFLQLLFITVFKYPFIISKSLVLFPNFVTVKHIYWGKL